MPFLVADHRHEALAPVVLINRVFINAEPLLVIVPQGVDHTWVTYVTGGGVGSTVNSEFAAVWAEAPAAEKAAAAEAVRKALETRKGMVVEGITATGESAVGILREVYRATPVGAGLAAVQVLLDADGQQIPATVTEAFRTLPAGAGGGTGE